MNISKFTKRLISDNELTDILDLEVGEFLDANCPNPKFYSNALRHIYASAVFTQMRGENCAYLYGILNELIPSYGQ